MIWLMCVLPPSCRGTSSHSPVCRAEGPPGRSGGPETERPGTGSPSGLSASWQRPVPPAWPRSQSGSASGARRWGWTCRGSVGSAATGGRCRDCPEERRRLWGLSWCLWRRDPRLAGCSALSASAHRTTQTDVRWSVWEVISHFKFTCYSFKERDWSFVSFSPLYTNSLYLKMSLNLIRFCVCLVTVQNIRAQLILDLYAPILISVFKS